MSKFEIWFVKEEILVIKEFVMTQKKEGFCAISHEEQNI